VNTSLLGAYLVTITLLMIAPGPDMMFALATGMRSGPRAGFLAAVGAAAGEVVHITAAALGLAAIFHSVPLLYDGFRFAGAGYLLYLGIQTIRRRSEPVALDHGHAAAGASRAFWQGAVTNLLNPKMALFTVAFLPQFVDPERGHVVLQFFVLGVCFIVMEIIVDGTVGMLAGRFSRALSRQRSAKALHVVSGSVFIGLGTKIVVSR
jgi:threonine/homoserine/homoserine lactone efflux protein